MKKTILCALAALLCLGLIGCSDGGNDEPDNPVGPNSCDLPAPTNVSVQVTTLGCDINNCQASFTVQSPVSLARVQWSFPGGSPAESSNINGVVIYPRPSSLPAIKAFTLTICSCPIDKDINGASCRGTNGTMTFTSGAFASTFSETL